MMTEKQYREEIVKLSKAANFSYADDTFYAKLDSLTEDLKEMIISNTEDLVAQNGTNYYVSNDGNDENDGKSPDTAFATIDRLNAQPLNEGDAVLFRRGDTFRGMTRAQNGVTYSAYGTGAKPKLYHAWDGMDGTWVKTDRENIWCFDTVLPDKEIGLIVFNDGECYAEKKPSIDDLKNNLDFNYNSEWVNKTGFDNRIYLYCKDGNPSEVFKEIDISRAESIIWMENRSHDITIKNLELRYAQDIYFVKTDPKNISMSYCVCKWTGGPYFIGQPNLLRYGGGAGCWLGCDNITFDHCYFYQQFDSGVTPQYDDWHSRTYPSVFKNFITTDCLFEKIEYSLEYFQTQKNFDDNRYENLYFGYNLCIKGGQGFGDKTHASAYVKTWNHENPCIDSAIEYNVFDRAAALSLEIYAHDYGKKFTDVSYKMLPRLSHNIYIEPRNKIFADINGIRYPFNEYSYAAFNQLGIENDAVYIFSEK